MLLELVEDLVHLERRENGFDEHRRLDRPLRHAQLVLRHHENVVPQPRLEMTLQLGQIEIRTATAGDELLRIVEKEQREVEEAARDRRAVDFDVLLGEMPAARAHEERSDLRVQLVLLAFGRDVVDPAADRVGR